MPIEVFMPALSPTMTEGNIVEWFKKEGDSIAPGEVIVAIETDKAIMEYESADSGILGKIIYDAGSNNVPVNSVIALLLEKDEDKKILETYQISTQTTNLDSNNNNAKEDINKDNNTNETITPAPSSVVISNENNYANQFDLSKIKDSLDEHSINKISSNNKRLFISPLAEKIAENYQLNINKIVGSGPKGRIIADDVNNYLKNNGLIHNNIVRNNEDYQVIRNNMMRNVIAKRLLESKQLIPHFYLSTEFNLERLLDLRVQLNEDSPLNDSNKPLYKTSVNDFIIKAVAMALKDVPQANSSWAGEAIVYYNNIDVSIAVAIDDGLITPIIKNADQKSIIMISNEMKILAQKARTGTLQPEEFQGGGFSISNLGMYGIKQFQAIVNPPQTAILAVGAASKKPIVTTNNKIEIASICNFSLSADHRVVDGSVGALFLQALKKYIENPIKLLL